MSVVLFLFDMQAMLLLSFMLAEAIINTTKPAMHDERLEDFRYMDRRPFWVGRTLALTYICIRFSLLSAFEWSVR